MEWQSELKINGYSQEDIKDNIKKYPSLQGYYEMISKELNCNIEDIVYLNVYSINRMVKIQGMDIKSFFPFDIRRKINRRIINSNYNTSDLCVGTVLRIDIDETIFIADNNIGPWTVYTNKNKLI